MIDVSKGDDMLVFDLNSSKKGGGAKAKDVVAWGPTAVTKVKVSAFSDGEKSSGIIDDTWVLSNFSIGAHEIVDIRQCFNDVSFMYALGNDQRRCSASLTFIVFVGEKCGDTEAGSFSAVKKGLAKYSEKRISLNKKPSNITIGNFSTRGWLVSIEIGSLDASRGLCYGTLSFIMQLEGEAGKAKK